MKNNLLSLLLQFEKKATVFIVGFETGLAERDLLLNQINMVSNELNQNYLRLINDYINWMSYCNVL